MRKRILCTLLALGLLLAMLPVTAGAADVKELNLADGYIIIRPNEYVVSGSGLPEPQPAAEKYIISAKGTLDTVYNISIGNSEGAPGIYHVTLKNLNVNCNNGPMLQIYENSTVYLTLEGSSQLNVQNENATAILLHSNSTLNISGAGTLGVESKGAAVISGSEGCAINISGEGTNVLLYNWSASNGDKSFAIRDDGYPNYDLKVSVTDGAELWAHGGIKCKELKLDDTATLWSQAWATDPWHDNALDCEEVKYSSERWIYLYYYLPQPSAISVLRSTTVQSGTAYKILDSSVPNPPTCDWEVKDGGLYSNETLLLQNVWPLDKETSFGSWAYLAGQPRTVTPPVTPVKDPEGDLLQKSIGSGLFFVPDDFPFYDVDSNDWFYEPVKSAWANELIDGVTARYYMPDNTLTVAQAVKLAAALHQKQSVGFVTLQNGGTHWYDNYVNYAVANGLIEAAYQSKSAEAMNAPVTRAEFVHILSKTLVGAKQLNTVNSIPDVKAGDAYADEIFAFYRAGILTGSDRLGTFHPESSLKRSEAAAILVRLYDATQRQYITLR